MSLQTSPHLEVFTDLVGPLREEDIEVELMLSEISTIRSRFSSELLRLIQLANLGDEKAINTLSRELVRRDNIVTAEILQHSLENNDLALLHDVDRLRDLIRIIKFVDSSYNDALDTLAAFNLYNPMDPQDGDVSPPSKREVIRAFLEILGPRQIEVIASMKDPVFQLIPVTSMKRYLDALNSELLFMWQTEAYLGAYSDVALENADRRDLQSSLSQSVIAWKMAITEGILCPYAEESVGTFNRTWSGSVNPIALADEFSRRYGNPNETNISGVDFKRQILLIMHALKNGHRLGTNERGVFIATMLNEEEVNDSGGRRLMPFVAWQYSRIFDRIYDRVVVAGSIENFTVNSYHFRISVGGDV